MVDLNFNFDATQVPPTEAFDPLPAGWYTAFIESSESKQSQNNPNNGMLVLTFVIQDEAFKGRKVFHHLNLWNENQTAKEIGYRELSAISHAISEFNFNNTEVLHNKPMLIKLNLIPAKDGYEAKNTVKGFKALENQVQQPVLSTQSVQPAQGGFPGQQQPQANQAPQQQSTMPRWAQEVQQQPEQQHAQQANATFAQEPNNSQQTPAQGQDTTQNANVPPWMR